MAKFTNEACATDGVKPTDPLLFICKIYDAPFLRVILPSGHQEIISVGDTVADVVLPHGFTAVSLDIREIDHSKRNFNLILSIDSAFQLEGGEITCDNASSLKSAKAGCPIGKLISPSNFSLHSQ